MLINTNTQNNIIKAMERGAKLIVVYAPYHEEFGTVMRDAYLEHNGRRLQITHHVRNLRWRPLSEDQGKTKLTREFLDITRHECVKRGYIPNSDYGDYYEMWEHINTPTPRWVKEQWYSPVSVGDPN